MRSSICTRQSVCSERAARPERAERRYEAPRGGGGGAVGWDCLFHAGGSFATPAARRSLDALADGLGADLAGWRELVAVGLDRTGAPVVVLNLSRRGRALLAPLVAVLAGRLNHQDTKITKNPNPV